MWFWVLRRNRWRRSRRLHWICAQRDRSFSPRVFTGSDAGCSSCRVCFVFSSTKRGCSFLRFIQDLWLWPALCPGQTQKCSLLLYTSARMKQDLSQNLGGTFTFFSRFCHKVTSSSAAISAGSGLVTVTDLPRSGMATSTPSGSVRHSGSTKVCRAQWRACRPIRSRLPP